MREEAQPIVCGSRPTTTTDVPYPVNQDSANYSGTTDNPNPERPYNAKIEGLPPPPDYNSCVNEGQTDDNSKTALKSDYEIS